MIPAGQSGKLVAKVHTRPTQHGSLKKTIVVALDDPTVKSINLTLAFTVEAVIEIFPRTQLYINSVVGDAAEGRVLLHRTDGKPLEISQIRFDNDKVALAAQPFDSKDSVPSGFEAKAGDVWLTASIPDDVEPGQFTGSAWLTTNHPKMKEIEIPVTVRLRPVMEVRPERVQLWIQGGQSTSRGTLFRMVHNGTAAFRITGIDVADEDLVKVEILDEGESRAHSVRVSPAEAVTAEDVQSPRSTEIVVHTSLEGHPEIVVPVAIAGRRPVTRPLQRPPTSRPKPMPMPTGTPGHG